MSTAVMTSMQGNCYAGISLRMRLLSHERVQAVSSCYRRWSPLFGTSTCSDRHLQMHWQDGLVKSAHLLLGVGHRKVAFQGIQILLSREETLYACSTAEHCLTCMLGGDNSYGRVQAVAVPKCIA